MAHSKRGRSLRVLASWLSPQPAATARATINSPQRSRERRRIIAHHLSHRESRMPEVILSQGRNQSNSLRSSHAPRRRCMAQGGRTFGNGRGRSTRFVTVAMLVERLSKTRSLVTDGSSVGMGRWAPWLSQLTAGRTVWLAFATRKNRARSWRLATGSTPATVRCNGCLARSPNGTAPSIRTLVSPLEAGACRCGRGVMPLAQRRSTVGAPHPLPVPLDRPPQPLLEGRLSDEGERGGGPGGVEHAPRLAVQLGGVPPSGP